MGKINVLDSSVYNRIAAGEVVERPASIVKELVENSIDAGAQKVSIDIENGGVDCIRVADNGSGMAPEDVPLAFMSHATSKIRAVSDLDEIGTLGFRGEALPSIAAVAHITLVSRRPDAELGYGIVLENGKVYDEGERGCPFGTTIIVRNVFGNIPARKKFLAKPYIEQNEISNIVLRFILANPSVAFKYTVDGKLLYNTDGRSAESALYAVYGRDFYENMLPVQHAMSDIELSGFIGKPYYTKHNRMFQTLIVNGRYVVNADVSYCVYECCSDFLMKRQYPVFVLYLRLPHDMVDVNIHPNKLDVKFANLPMIKKVISHAVRSALGIALTDPQRIQLTKTQEEPQRQVVDSVLPGIPATTQIIKHAPLSLREPPTNSLFGGCRRNPVSAQGAAVSPSVGGKSQHDTNDFPKPQINSDATQKGSLANSFEIERSYSVTSDKSIFPDAENGSRSISDAMSGRPNAATSLTQAIPLGGDLLQKPISDGFNPADSVNVDTKKLSEETCSEGCLQAVKQEAGVMGGEAMAKEVCANDNAETTRIADCSAPGVRKNFEHAFTDTDPQNRHGIACSETGARQSYADACAAVDTTAYEKLWLLEQASMPMASEADYRIIGCLFRTYILVEADGAAYVIDQHAAHERLLFEAYLSQAESGAVAVQPLLIPFSYPISHGDAGLLRERMDEIRALGFSIRLEETTMFLDSVPVVVSDMDMQSFLPQLLQSLPQVSLTSGALLRDALMQAACKAAVKGDEELSSMELEKLLRRVIETGVPLYCPHGRPIAVRIERRELEKWFKRIV